jgi:hypothetical protein
MSDQVWCPTRGYFVIGASGGAPAPQALAESAGSEGGAPEAAAPAAAASSHAAAPLSSSGGARSWAPTRGYFVIGGGASAAEPSAAPAQVPKVAPAKAAAAAVSVAAPASGAPAPAPKSAVAAAKKETAKPAAAKSQSSESHKKESAADPSVESVTTVPSLTDAAAERDIARILYDDPDSETTLYRVPTLNVLFALTSLVLLISTIAVIWQDYSRDWKRIQKDFRSELVASYEATIAEQSARSMGPLAALEPPLEAMLAKLGAERPELPVVPRDADPAAFESSDSRRFRAQAQRVRALIGAVREAVELEPKYAELAANVVRANEVVNLADRKLRFTRGDQQSRISHFLEEKKHVFYEQSATETGRQVLLSGSLDYVKKWDLEVDGLLRALETAQIEASARRGELDAHRANLTLVEADRPLDIDSIDAAFGRFEQPIKLVEGKIRSVESSIANAIRDAVLLDALQPIARIEKAVVDDILLDMNFLQVPRVDRCKTCHINIDAATPEFARFESPKWGTVYQTHPRPDLYLQDTSPHPYLRFGCTGCHYGDGRATDFTIAAHTPSDAEERDDWENRFHWHKKHHQVQPMRREKDIAGGCRKCHASEDHLDGADRLNLGLEAVRTYGCFGCHRMEGFDVLAGDPKGEDDFWKRNKVGPSLKYIADKTSPEFLYKWINDPRHFRPSTRMPRFFGLTNNSGQLSILRPDQSIATIDYSVRGSVEALALATYLHSNSDSRERDIEPADASGDAARGRDAFRTLGCLGCHSVKVEAVKPETPALADLQSRALTLVTELRARAGARKSAPAAKGADELADRYEEIAASLEELESWFGRLLLHRDLEGLYTAARKPLFAATALETRDQVADSVLADVGAVVDGFYDRWAHSTFAPDLSTIGSKFDQTTQAGREKASAWLLDWILDPARHDPDTVMPRFRLDEDEEGRQKALDIVSYLLTLRDRSFEESVSPSAETLTVEARTILQDITFEYLRANHTTNEARDLSTQMSVPGQLTYIGHRLVRRYGCYGCHNGIRDLDPDPTATPALEPDGTERTRYFDLSQPIGVELSTWGMKLSDRLDFGAWGHQPDGVDAIPHDRYDWLTSKLSDTRRFDVLPRRVWTDKESGDFSFVQTNQLLQKKPEDLLKMPLFPFHEEPEIVDAVATFITSQVTDRVAPQMKRQLTGEQREIELGARLIRKYNCAGCHRVGVDLQSLALGELPSFAEFDDEDIRAAEWQKETWLARPFTVRRPLRGTGDPAGSVTLPAGMLLNSPVLDPAVPGDSQRANDVDPVSAAQAIARHYDPLPAFIQDVLRCLDTFGDPALLDSDLLAFVKSATEGQGPGQRFGEFLRQRGKSAWEPTAAAADVALARLLDKPYDPLVLAWLDGPSGEGERWEEIAAEYYGRVLTRFVAESQRVPVRGFGEGRIRYYYGQDAETRSNAPPPLVRQGERVRGDWFFHFLLDVRPIRPWLKVRMPSFRLTDDESRAIVAWFRNVYDVPASSERFEADRFVESEAVEGGKLFVEKYQCTKCHPTATQLPTYPVLAHAAGLEKEAVPVSAPDDSYFIAYRGPDGRVRVRPGFTDAASAEAEGERLPAGTAWAVGEPWSKSNWGPNLSLARERLRPDWISLWVQNPKDFMPGTKMPNFFGDRDRFRGDMTGHLLPEARDEIRRILQYLVHMRTVGASEAQPLGGGGN